MIEAKVRRKKSKQSKQTNKISLNMKRLRKLKEMKGQYIRTQRTNRRLLLMIQGCKNLKSGLFPKFRGNQMKGLRVEEKVIWLEKKKKIGRGQGGCGEVA